jgi:hypothetical protein
MTIKLTPPANSQLPSTLYVLPEHHKKFEALIEGLCQDVTLTSSQRDALKSISDSLIPTKLTPTGDPDGLVERPPFFGFMSPDAVHMSRNIRVQELVAQVLQIKTESLFEWTNEQRSSAMHSRSSQLCRGKKFEEARRLADTIPDKATQSKALREITDHLISASLAKPEFLSLAIETAMTIPDLSIRVKALMDFIEPLILQDKKAQAEEIALKAIASAGDMNGESRILAAQEIKSTLRDYSCFESLKNPLKNLK